MASLATLHHVTHVSSAHHPSLHSADHSMISNHIGGSGHTMTIQPIASHPHPMPPCQPILRHTIQFQSVPQLTMIVDLITH